ncbi:hypothetical protein F7725_010600 [Dissostichus mawsoni]|uniref:Uncharacterized protein n=1 Tax=Dissostichus mawsoni TaxID=36200 RepID=A0A7J5XNZ1_DISMA|nr:hypothetical protein F7725_010600 [Dissostichus mawsoni]
MKQRAFWEISAVPHEDPAPTFHKPPASDLRPLPDVAMTGNCTHECTEFGHSDSCWMPGGEPSPLAR